MAIEINTLIQPDCPSEIEINLPRADPASLTVSLPGSKTVSVLVPSYNHERFVRRCLLSIIGQSHRPLELIVIDDGSQDDSVRKIEAELKDCPFSCRLIVRPHKGLAATLNEGLKLSCGEYFAYLGSDDVWLPGFVESRVRVLESRELAVLAYGHSFVINEEDQIIECTKDWAAYGNIPAREMLLKQSVPFSPSVLYRRQALERHSWNESAFLEDYDLYLRLSADGEFAFDNQILCAWRSHRENSSRDLELMLKECLEAQRRAGLSLKLTTDELNRADAKLKWRYAGDFIRNGQKGAAIKLLCLNLKGAPSYAAVGRMMLVVSVPTRFLRWRRQYLQRRNIKFYGSINPGQ